MRGNRFGLYILMFIVSLAALFIISGSTHNVEIQQRLLCHAMGIDFEQGEFLVSLQVFKPSESGSDTPVDITKSNIEVITAKGETVSKALENCEAQRGKVVFLGHLKLICLGEGVDISHPKKLFGFCLSSKTVYLGLDVCCAQGTARELMETRLTTEMVSTENYIQLISQNSLRSRCGRCRLIDLLSGTEMKAATLPVISVKNDRDKEKEPELEIRCTAIVTENGRLPYYLDAEDSAALFLLNDNGKETDILVESEDEKLNVRAEKTGLFRSLKIEGQKLKYTAHLTVVLHRPKDFQDTELSAEAVRQVKNKLKEQFDRGFETVVKQRGADIVGLKKLLRAEYPKAFLEYEKKLSQLLSNSSGGIEITCYVE